MGFCVRDCTIAVSCVGKLSIFAAVFKNIIKKKKKKTVVTIVLNVLFCGIMLWLFTRNSILRPCSDSIYKEALAGLLLLGSLYVNYFLLYPKIYRNRPLIYWLVIVAMAVVLGFVDLAIAYNGIVSCNAQVIQYVGRLSFFSKILFFIIGRNLALNFFPFLLRERQHFQQSLEKEVKVVYQTVRMFDVTDIKNKLYLVNIDDIFYCYQERNSTSVHLVQDVCYYRLGSMKHLEQLLGNKDFIRITTNVLVPFRYIRECKDNMVIMKKMSWENEPTIFHLEPKTQKEISKRVIEGVQRYRGEVAAGDRIPKKPTRRKVKRKPAKPSDEKTQKVLSYIESHPNCNSKGIIDGTKIPLSSVERCISVLKKQGLIKHTGSKRNGGYDVVSPRPERERVESVQQEEKGTTIKLVQETHDKGKPAEPSSKE